MKIENVGPDSHNTYADVSRDTRKCKYAPSYLCAVPTKLDTPENRLPTTNVTCLRPSYRGRIVTPDAFAAPIDFLCTYANEGDTPIHKRSCARRIIYAVCVRLTSGVKLFPI